jgi:hypothetical protein
MRRGRSRRALQAVQPQPTAGCKIKLRDGGYISAAEMACRCSEREATYRAAESCKTFEAVSAAVGAGNRDPKPHQEGSPAVVDRPAAARPRGPEGSPWGLRGRRA